MRLKMHVDKLMRNTLASDSYPVRIHFELGSILYEVLGGSEAVFESHWK